MSAPHTMQRRRTSLVAGLVALEVVIIVVLLLFRDCCATPAGLARFEGAAGEVVLVAVEREVPNGGRLF